MDGSGKRWTPTLLARSAQSTLVDNGVTNRPHIPLISLDSAFLLELTDKCRNKLRYLNKNILFSVLMNSEIFEMIYTVHVK